jgi:hypothetical protein
MYAGMLGDDQMVDAVETPTHGCLPFRRQIGARTRASHRTCVCGFVRTQALIARLELSSRSRNLEVGTILSTTFAIYELADGETVVVAKELFSQIAADPDWRRDAPAVAAVVDRQGLRVARVLERLRRIPSREASVWPAA